MALSAFQPQGGTLIIASTAASATTATQVSSAGGIQGAWLVNLSTNDAYVAISASSAVAAAVPTTASSTGSFPLLQRTDEKLTVPPNCWLSAITTAGQANLAVTLGFGL